MGACFEIPFKVIKNSYTADDWGVVNRTSFWKLFFFVKKSPIQVSLLKSIQTNLPQQIKFNNPCLHQPNVCISFFFSPWLPLCFYWRLIRPGLTLPRPTGFGAASSTVFLPYKMVLLACFQVGITTRRCIRVGTVGDFGRACFWFRGLFGCVLRCWGLWWKVGCGKWGDGINNKILQAMYFCILIKHNLLPVSFRAHIQLYLQSEQFPLLQK